MNRYLLLVAGALFSGSALFSQTLSVESQIVQLGKVNEADVSSKKEIVISNTGDADLIISDVSVDSKSLQLKLKDNKVKAGKSTVLEVVFVPKNFKGRLNRSITIASNDKANPTKSLAVTADVVTNENAPVNNYNFSINDIVRTDKLSFSLRDVKNTQVVNDTIKLLNCVNEKVTVGLDDLPAFVSVLNTPVLEPYGQGELVIKVDFPKSDKWGYVRERMFWVFNGEKDQRAVSLTANVSEDFSQYTDEQLKNAPSVVFENKVFQFDTLLQGESSKYVFKFKNEGKSDLVIRNTKASCGCTVTKPDRSVIGPGEESFIDATFNSRGKRGMQNKSITITTNDPKNSTVVLYMKGYVKYDK